MELIIKTKIIDENAVLQLKGSMNSSEETALFKKEILSELEKGVKNFVISLADIKWMNSAGIGALIGAYKMVTPKGGRFLLAGAQESVRNSLIYFQINDILKNFESEESALEQF